MGKMTSEEDIVEATKSDGVSFDGLENPAQNKDDYEELQYPDLPSPDLECPDSGTFNPIVRFNFEYCDAVPFGSVCQPVSLRIHNPNIFLPDKPIDVKLTTYERSTSNLLNPNLYSIEITHGGFQWTIRRRYKHFQQLHQQLQLMKATLTIPFPTRTHRQQRASFKTMRIKRRSSRNARSAKFPKRPDALISEENINQRMTELENYLKAILANDIYRQHNETLNFLEISRISFVDQLGEKKKEGMIRKRNGEDNRSRIEACMDDFPCCCCCMVFYQSCCKSWGIWRSRWLFVKDTFVGYMRPDTGEVGCVLLMDQDFKVISGSYQTGSSHGVIISNLSRTMFFKDWTKRKAQEWVDAIQDTANNTGKDFTQLNRFCSFAPVRSNSDCTWFVDGCDYMSSVAMALESAKEEIMIADWWLSPEIHLKRPVFEGNHWRLDAVLHRKAEQGVRIYILLYKEVELALGINSFYSKKQLCSKHPNIRVLRHPDHVAAGVLFWAHHEKLVIVDQSIAFLGGIDLCYGRWDDEQHRLIDLGSVTQTSKQSGMLAAVQTSHTVGQQRPSALLHLAKAANSVTLGTVTNITLSPTKDNKHKDMNSNDDGAKGETKETKEGGQSLGKLSRRVTVVNRMRNLTARGREWADELKDKGRHMKEDSKEWVERHFQKSRAGSEIDANEIPAIDEETENAEDEETNIDEVDAVVTSKRIEDVGGVKANRTRGALSGFQGSTKLWIGKDYTNFIVKDFSQLDEPLHDGVDRSTTPRMPWHDIGCAVTGKAARDAARHFIQRWNAVKTEKMKENPAYPLLVPKSYQSFSPNYRVDGMPSTRADCQVLRSGSTWSIGTRTTEDSIHQAYISTIENAKHYIYIENQFFITLAGPSDDVTNRIGRALFERILRAHTEEKRFRVYVVMPLLPGFEGQIGTTTGTAIQAITHWNYASICRGPCSLMGKLREANIDPMNYVSFYGLRTHSELKGQLVTELIYIHSKLMIVDDVTVICGSANINDRSLNGKRDSELALIVQDVEFEDSVMDDQPYKAGLYASSLRKQLFREHLGITGSDVDIRDPVADSFYKGTWIRIASLNTKIYEDVFRCVPSDSATSFARLRAFQAQFPLAFTEPQAAQHKLTQIQGQLVLLPLHFLSQENLTPAAGTAEALMPTSLWT